MSYWLFSLKYFAGYPEELQQQVRQLVEAQKLKQFLLKKYPQPHQISNDSELRDYVMQLKNQYLKRSAPISKIMFDGKIHVAERALGLHRYVSRVQGGKLKSKNEIRISHLFKPAPQEFLNMIVVHELAHIKEKSHNKAFYQLCEHMLSTYHQLEFDTRLYLTLLEMDQQLYSH